MRGSENKRHWGCGEGRFVLYTLFIFICKHDDLANISAQFSVRYTTTLRIFYGPLRLLIIILLCRTFIVIQVVYRILIWVPYIWVLSLVFKTIWDFGRSLFPQSSNHQTNKIFETVLENNFTTCSTAVHYINMNFIWKKYFFELFFYV